MYSISFPAQVDKIDKLVEACKPSPLGRGKETVHDEDYRKARELSKDDFSITADILSASGVLESISSLIAPVSDDGGAVIARLSKLNVYASGGFFKAHRDTPRQGRHIGTLVVALPSPYKGGILRAAHEGDEINFSWEDEISESDHGISLPWAFIFSDVEHEVLPVTSGIRISLTFDIFASRGTHPAEYHAIEARTLPIFGNIENLLKNEDFLPAGGRVAIALSHVYPLDTSEANSDAFPRDLKGSDAALYCALSALELTVKICAVYTLQDDIDDRFPEDEYGPVGPPRGTIYPMILFVADKFRFIESDSSGGCDETSEREVLENEYGAVADPNIICKAHSLGHCLQDIHPSFSRQGARKPKSLGAKSGGYIAYGNEATWHSVYVNAAIVMDIPPKGKGVREASHDGKRKRTATSSK
ncbi:hypothetical protein BU17DRAFT_35565 [Hysterangium stoloniferum]|nr:hypothetical protein BU17DRAFT_35565 [Hysterangium stoloniferum]